MNGESPQALEIGIQSAKEGFRGGWTAFREITINSKNIEPRLIGKNNVQVSLLCLKGARLAQELRKIPLSDAARRNIVESLSDLFF